MAIAMIRGSPSRGITGTSTNAHDDRRDVEHRRRQRRHEVVVQRVQHAHRGRRDRDDGQERQHDARQLGRSARACRARARSRRRRGSRADARTPCRAATSSAVTTSSAFSTLLPSRHASSLPCRVRWRVKVGTNAALIAPSANRSRTRFGIRNATMNASISLPRRRAPRAPDRARARARGSSAWRRRSAPADRARRTPSGFGRCPDLDEVTGCVIVQGG